MRDGTALAERIAERRAGSGDPRSLVGELRRALVLVPLDGGGLWTGESGGIRWIFGFTDEAALARFAKARAAGPTGDGRDTSRPWEFAELRGARLLDETVRTPLSVPTAGASPLPRTVPSGCTNRQEPRGPARDPRQPPPPAPAARRSAVPARRPTHRP